MTHVPSHYDAPNHIAKLALTEDFKSTARAHGVTPEQLIVTLAEGVKAVVAAIRAQELSEFEKLVGDRALSNLKLKADKAA